MTHPIFVTEIEKVRSGKEPWPEKDKMYENKDRKFESWFYYDRTPTGHGCYYQGETDSNGKRDGRGISIFPDFGPHSFMDISNYKEGHAHGLGIRLHQSG